MKEPASIRVSGRPGIPAHEVRRVVAAVLAHETRRVEISITFLGLTAMQRMNAAFKRRDHPTDVLAFELQLPDGDVTGDIYLCPGMAAREARSRGLHRHEELIRLIVHGTLHVLGHDHPDGDDREGSPMWRLQESLVAILA